MDLDMKRRRFLHRYEQQDVRSWTMADQRTFEALKAQQLTSRSEPAEVTTASLQAAMDVVVDEEPDVTVVEPIIVEGSDEK
jgi:hypothetical protein